MKKTQITKTKQKNTIVNRGYKNIHHSKLYKRTLSNYIHSYILKAIRKWNKYITSSYLQTVYILVTNQKMKGMLRRKKHNSNINNNNNNNIIKHINNNNNNNNNNNSSKKQTNKQTNTFTYEERKIATHIVPSRENKIKTLKQSIAWETNHKCYMKCIKMWIVITKYKIYS